MRKAILFSILAAASVPVFAAPSFSGFDECAHDREALWQYFNANVKPSERTQDDYTFPTKGMTVLGVPITSISLGICNEKNGVVERGCGWTLYTQVTIAMPLKEAGARLKAHTGLDFTREVRSWESDAPLQPMLTKGDRPGESVLFCDAGSI